MPRNVYSKEKKSKKAKKPTKEAKLYCPICCNERGLSYARTLFLLEKIFNEKCTHLYGTLLVEGWSIKAAQQHRLFWACDVCLSSNRGLEAKPWLQTPSLANPYFAYTDELVKCEDCSSDFVFSAKEQSFWYEQLKFVTQSRPKQCPKCRRSRRIYKRYFHDLQRALETLEPKDSNQLINVAELYLRIEHLEKAMEFFRQAKNLVRDKEDKQVLTQRISELKSKINLKHRTH